MKKYLPIIFLILLGTVCRFLPHLPNFAPLGAIALFAGLYLPRRWALVLPLAVLIMSDFFIGFYSWPIMLSVYAGFIITALIGLLTRKNIRFATVLGGTVLGSVLFYLLTNWAVWAFGTMYDHDLAGLMQSYALALPFFRNSLAGDIFYTAMLVGGYELAMNWSASKKLILEKITIK